MWVSLHCPNARALLVKCRTVDFLSRLILNRCLVASTIVVRACPQYSIIVVEGNCARTGAVGYSIRSQRCPIVRGRRSCVLDCYCESR